MIDTIYHLCLYAYLRGNRKDASMYFDFLKDEYRRTGKVDSLSQEQYRSLKDIRHSLATGTLPGRQWVDDPGPAPESSEGNGAKQDELVRRIHTEALRDLCDALGQELRLQNLEHPCPPYGKVDMLYMSDDTAYPLEVKTKTGLHDIIGQILKYNLHMKLHLHYHLYSRVRPVTVCAAYDPHVLRELKANGVETLVYSEGQGRLKVTPV